MKIQNKKAIIKASVVSVVISLLLFIISYRGLNLEISRLKEKEKLDTMQQFIKYKANLENIIFSKIALTHGYLAYIKTNPNLSQEETTKYLSNLIDPNDKLIKNLSILKDTTIVWAYPLKGNEAAIGKNLLDIQGQKDDVFKVKNNLEQIFTGPITLVQGGAGFISRIPITLENGSYWGQLSVVIDGEELLKQSELLENKGVSLKIAIFNKIDYPNTPFYGDVSILNENPLIFDMPIENLTWTIAAIPENGWYNNKTFYIFWFIIIIFISLFIGILAFLLIYTKYIFKKQATIDSLTKVYNRTYLYDYAIPSIIKNKKVNETIAVLLIDFNDFKMINDSYGHKAGDEALKVTSRRLKAICDKYGFVIRLGGDEFLVLLKLDEIEVLGNIINSINSITQKGFSFEGEVLNISISIGSSLYPVDSNNIEDVIQIADNRMYEKKRVYKCL